jgi:hypothetical protein
VSENISLAENDCAVPPVVFRVSVPQFAVELVTTIVPTVVEDVMSTRV